MSEAATTSPQVPAGANDPSVRMPKSVRHAAARSEDLQKMLTGEPQPQGEGAAPPADQPVTQQVTPEQHAPPVQTQAPVPAEEWERRYRSMEGRFRKATESLENANSQINHLSNEVMQLRSAVQAPPQDQSESLLTPEEIAEYGPEFVDMVKRAAAEMSRPLLHEIGRLQAQLGQVSQEVQGQRIEDMHQKMDAAFPQWREINVHPRFVEWSNLHDTFSGAIRKRLMQEAWDRGDARRVTAFFQGFLAEEAALDPSRAQPSMPQGGPTPYAAPVAPQGRVTLESLAAPGSARSAAGAPPAEKPVYTPQQITQFYADVAQGRYRGREVEKARIEADIHTAQFEGRILDTRRPFPRDQFQK